MTTGPLPVRYEQERNTRTQVSALLPSSRQALISRERPLGPESAPAALL